MASWRLRANNSSARSFRCPSRNAWNSRGCWNITSGRNNSRTGHPDGSPSPDRCWTGPRPPTPHLKGHRIPSWSRHDGPRDPWGCHLQGRSRNTPLLAITHHRGGREGLEAGRDHRRDLGTDDPEQDDPVHRGPGLRCGRYTRRSRSHAHHNRRQRIVVGRPS